MSEDLIKVVLDYTDDKQVDTGLFKMIYKGDKLEDYTDILPNNS